jgi:RNA polymerase sigma factor (sigma-70 family)
MGLQLNTSVKEEPVFSKPDKDLWRRFKAGDQQVFSYLYRQYIQALYNYGMKVTDDTVLVEDSIQELFIYLWKTRENLSDTDSIKFYLFKSLRRRLISSQEQILRQTKKNVVVTKDREVSEFSHEQMLVSRQAETEQQEKLTHSLNALTKRQREAILLKFYDNLSFQEVAEVMSLNIKSTYNLVSKAIEALKENARVKACY